MQKARKFVNKCIRIEESIVKLRVGGHPRLIFWENLGNLYRFSILVWRGVTSHSMPISLLIPLKKSSWEMGLVKICMRILFFSLFFCLLSFEILSLVFLPIMEWGGWETALSLASWMKRSQKRLLACRLIAQIVSKALHARMTCSTTHTCVANDYPLRLILKYIFLWTRRQSNCAKMS